MVGDDDRASVSLEILEGNLAGGNCPGSCFILRTPPGSDKGSVGEGSQQTHRPVCFAASDIELGFDGLDRGGSGRADDEPEIPGDLCLGSSNCGG